MITNYTTTTCPFNEKNGPERNRPTTPTDTPQCLLPGLARAHMGPHHQPGQEKGMRARFRAGRSVAGRQELPPAATCQPASTHSCRSQITVPIPCYVSVSRRKLQPQARSSGSGCDGYYDVADPCGSLRGYPRSTPTYGTRLFDTCKKCRHTQVRGGTVTDMPLSCLASPHPVS